MANGRSWIGRTKGEDKNREKQSYQRVTSQKSELIRHTMSFDNKPWSPQINGAIEQECNDVIQTSPVEDDGGVQEIEHLNREKQQDIHWIREIQIG